MTESREQQPVHLKIAGKEYRIRSSDSQEHLRRVAVFTDRKITERLKSSFITREDAAVITARNLADELIRAQDDNTRLRQEIWRLRNPGRDQADASRQPNPSRDI